MKLLTPISKSARMVLVYLYIPILHESFANTEYRGSEINKAILWATYHTSTSPSPRTKVFQILDSTTLKQHFLPPTPSGGEKKWKEKLCRGMKWEDPVLIQTWQAQFYHCNILFDFSTKIFSDHLELLQAGGQNFVIPFQSKWQISNRHVANAQPKGSPSSLIQSSLEFYTCSKNKVLPNKSAHLSIFQTEQRSCHFWTRQHFFRVWSYYPISQAGSRTFCKFH